jgi:hypothetical protein
MAKDQKSPPALAAEIAVAVCAVWSYPVALHPEEEEDKVRPLPLLKAAALRPEILTTLGTLKLVVLEVGTS